MSASDIENGQFRLHYTRASSPYSWPETYSTAIRYDASAAEFQSAVQSLPHVGAVHVTRSDEGSRYDAVVRAESGNAFDMAWRVTFLSESGDVSSLSVSETLAVPEVQHIFVYAGSSGSITAGSYKLRFNGATTASCLPFSASASDMETALNLCPPWTTYRNGARYYQSRRRKIIQGYVFTV